MYRHKKRIFSLLGCFLLLGSGSIAIFWAVLRLKTPVLTRMGRLCYTSRQGFMMEGWVSEHQALIFDDADGTYNLYDVNTHTKVPLLKLSSSQIEYVFASLNTNESKFILRVPPPMRARMTHYFTEQLPTDATDVSITNCTDSSHGNHRAWLISYFQASSPLALIIHRCFPAYKVTWRDVAAIWVSGVDGSQPHQVAIQYEICDSQQCDLLSFIDWLPDGKHLSFIYKNALYTVPVEH